jgi:hypothetical protein
MLKLLIASSWSKGQWPVGFQIAAATEHAAGALSLFV